jgi:hypothetical protein
MEKYLVIVSREAGTELYEAPLRVFTTQSEHPIMAKCRFQGALINKLPPPVKMTTADD